MTHDLPFDGLYLEKEKQGGEGAGGPIRRAVGAGVALDVVVARGAVGELAL